MGMRMYCKELGDKREYFHDNESPKFYGYVSEEQAGKSWKYLKGLGYVDASYYEHFYYEDSEEVVLSNQEFDTFITLFIQDLKNNDYKLRKSWLDTMEKLKQSPTKKVIWWG